MTANVVKTTDYPVLREDKEYWVRSDIVPIIRTRLLESITVSNTVPSLQDLLWMLFVTGSRTWEKMARASNAKKFSLVYQELGSEARRG